MINYREIIHLNQFLTKERFVFVRQFYLRQSALYVGIKIRATLIDLVSLVNMPVDDETQMFYLVFDWQSAVVRELLQHLVDVMIDARRQAIHNAPFLSTNTGNHPSRASSS